MTQKWSREELEQAHQHYMDTAARCAASGEWRDWADLFTDDAVYLEHTFGTFRGPGEIHDWISPLMAEWPNKDMNAFPHAIAGANFHIGIIAGKLNGVMPATTPSGWRTE